jgi:serine/threonine protein kinase
MSLAPGTNLGGYRVVEQIGRGGMATVYKAYQPALARYVAIKVLQGFLAEDEDFRERFRAEAVAVAGLRHPAILMVFDFGQQEDLSYLVSEFVDGGTLQDRLGKPLSLQQVVRMLAPIASALDYAHAHGILHRDVKPSNIL